MAELSTAQDHIATLEEGCGDARDEGHDVMIRELQDLKEACDETECRK